MGASKTPGAQIMSQQKRFNHAGGTGFTVSSGDVDDRGGAVHIPEDFNGSANRIQPGSHLIFGGACQQFTVDAFNPFGVRDCWVAHLAHSVLSLAGIKLCGQRLYQDSALCTDIYLGV